MLHTLTNINVIRQVAVWRTSGLQTRRGFHFFSNNAKNRTSFYILWKEKKSLSSYCKINIHVTTYANLTKTQNWRIRNLGNKQLISFGNAYWVWFAFLKRQPIPPYMYTDSFVINSNSVIVWKRCFKRLCTFCLFKRILSYNKNTFRYIYNNANC